MAPAPLGGRPSRRRRTLRKMMKATAAPPLGRSAVRQGKLCDAVSMNIGELSSRVEHISANYASRFGITRDGDWHLLKLHEEVGELTQAHLMRQGQARSKGLSPAQIDATFRAEAADVLCHALLLARHHDIDIVEEVRRKWLVWLEGSAAPDEVRPGQA
jgi:NTP pyrophosphatase (non-canonical NTP hydrolase)